MQQLLLCRPNSSPKKEDIGWARPCLQPHYYLLPPGCQSGCNHGGTPSTTRQRAVVPQVVGNGFMRDLQQTLHKHCCEAQRTQNKKRGALLACVAASPSDDWGWASRSVTWVKPATACRPGHTVFPTWPGKTKTRKIDGEPLLPHFEG